MQLQLSLTSLYRVYGIGKRQEQKPYDSNR